MMLKNVIKVAGAVALAAALTVTVGCGSSKKKGEDPVGPEEYVFDSKLVLGANEAWVDTFEIGKRNGFIFDEEGVFIAIEDDDDGAWAVLGGGTVTASDGVLEVMSGDLFSHLDFEFAKAKYTVSGGKLNLIVTLADEDESEWTYVFNKTSDVTPTATAKPRSLAKRNAKKALLFR